MNEYDDILNRIVEEFYDTGRLVLSEIRNAISQMYSEMRYGKEYKQGGDYENALDSYKKVLDLFDNHLTDEQRNELLNKKRNPFKRDIILYQIKELEKQIVSKEEENTKVSMSGRFLEKRKKEIDQNLPIIKRNIEELIDELEDLYNDNRTTEEKFNDYMNLVKSSDYIGYISLYYYQVETALKLKEVKDYRTALFHFKRAKEKLDDAVKDFKIQKSDLLFGDLLDDEIKKLEGETGEEEGLPLFKRGQIILDKDLFWLDLLKKNGEEINIEEYFDGFDKNYIYNADDITKETWGNIFCSEKNYKRYQKYIEDYGISCDIFRGEPKYYNLNKGQKVKFKTDANLSISEKSYIQCADRIYTNHTDNDVKKKSFILTVDEISNDYKKVNLIYDYGKKFKDGKYGNTEIEGKEYPCQDRGTIKDVQVHKLEPIEKGKDTTYYGAELQRRTIYKNDPETFPDNLKLTDTFYFILKDQLMELAANLQRLGIAAGDIDLRTKKIVKTSGGEYTETSLQILEPNTKIKDDKVISLYEKLKSKIFKGASTEQVKSIIPYLVEINKKLSEQKKINTGKIEDFVNELDFTNPENIDNVFKKIIKSVSSQYEYYWGNETKYFIEESDQGDKGLLNTTLNVELEFHNSIMEIIVKSNIKNLEESCVNIKNVVIDTKTMDSEVDRLYNMVNKDGYTEKFDIKCIKQINYDGAPIVRVGDYLDVKSKKNKDDFLGELSTPFKSSSFGKEIVDGTNTERKNCKIYTKIYNDLIDSLIVKMSKELEHIKGRVLGGDRPFKGLIIKDNIFVPLDSLKLYWSNKGMMSDHRISLRYKIDGAVYKITFDPEVCGVDCEEQEYSVVKDTYSSGDGFKQLESDIFKVTMTESTDRLDEIIENFFDTGKFVF
jgi:hypothetical protein